VSYINLPPPVIRSTIILQNLNLSMIPFGLLIKKDSLSVVRSNMSKVVINDRKAFRSLTCVFSGKYKLDCSV
jgi:hypothetical protein